MQIFTVVMALLGIIGTAFGILVACIALTPDKRAELRRVLGSIWKHLTKTVIPVLMALVCVVANCWEIYLFSVPDTAPSRGEILLMLVNIWNAVAYFFFGMVLFVFWLKDIIKKDFPFQAQT
ncbi:TPA: MotA/TolQ/ExbB proton channel family protein [Pseudomonas aeruginosa]|nr:MotA/TolQ/ExbB proton channel family protein [Pseudomonas aeruginosa]